jgi:putative oxidoreductase
MKSLLRLSFVPCSTDFGLLVLRLWLGLTLFFNHGWGKLMHYSAMSAHWSDPLHVSAAVSFFLTVLAETLFAAMVVLGVATRFAALVIAIEMGVAFFMIHHGTLTMGPGSGELAFLNLGPALAIVFAGGGRFVLCKYSNDVKAPAA